MTLIDGFINGVRGAFGLDSLQPESKAPAETPTPGRPASTVATTYDDSPPPAASAHKPDLFLDTARATPAIPPHMLADHAAAPPEAAQEPVAAPVAAASTTSSAATGGGAVTAKRLGSSTARAVVYDMSAPDASGAASKLGTVDNLTGNGDAAAAARNVQGGLDYYASTFGRSGIDGRGSKVDVLINDRTRGADGVETSHGNGGYYATPLANGSTYEAVHYGDGASYDAARGRVEQLTMLRADDLAVHELTHGVIRKETGYLGGEADEAGATNEAIADVMGASATRDWTIGEGLYTNASAYRKLRDIAHPDSPDAVHGLWSSMGEARAAQASGKPFEEHWASGILSTAAYRIQQRLGGETGWKAVEQVFYDVIDTNKLGDMSFAAVAKGVRVATAELYGAGSQVSKVVDEELRRSGI
jgi:Zn-dependent metalloprotease